MPLAFASLGSGSKGNGTLVESRDACLLIDCGFSIKETERRLAALGRSADDLSGILVTHEHSDHIRGVTPLARRYKLPVYMSPGTAVEARLKSDVNVHLVSTHESFSVAGIDVFPVAVPHDSREPVQYCLSYQGLKLGVLTDLGSVSGNVVEHFDQCDGLLLEANHDLNMLQAGPYPYFLKKRVSSDWGHLNNQQAGYLLSLVERSRIQTLVLGHISEQNNHSSLVEEAVSPWVEDVGKTLYACQKEGFPWQVIE